MDVSSSGLESPESPSQISQEDASPAEASRTTPGSRKRWREEEYDENELHWPRMVVEALELLEQHPTRYDFYHGLDDPELRYSVQLYAPEAMKKVRSAWGVNEAGFRSSLSGLDDSRASFQRNGLRQWVSKDELLLVKQLSFPEVAKLLSIIHDYSKFVCDSGGVTLLSKIFCAFREYPGAYYLVTENIPPAKEESSRVLPVCGSEFIQLQGALARDTLFLQKHKVMDYSLQLNLCGKKPGLVIEDILSERSPKECLKMLVKGKGKRWEVVERLVCCVWPSYRRKRAREQGDALVVDDKYHLQEHR